MLGLKLIHVNKGVPWNIPAPAPKGGESFSYFQHIYWCALANNDIVTPRDVLRFMTRPSMQAVVTMTVSLYWMG